MRACIVLSLFTLALAGCNRDTSAEGSSCDETRTALTMGETSPIGFSGSDVIGTVGHTYHETLVWDDGTTTGLTIGVSYKSGAVNYIDSEVSEDGGMEGAYPICTDRLEIEVEVTFKTDDGAFDETWSVAMSAETADEASFSRELDLATLNGTYEIRGLDPAEYDKVTASVRARLRADTSEGAVSEMGEKVEGDTASAVFGDTGTWSSSTTE
jgi:hypothetical protein